LDLYNSNIKMFSKLKIFLFLTIIIF